MTLKNLHTLESDGVDLYIKDDHFVNAKGSNKVSGPQIEFSNALAFPGLINSHDHLDFNLFPQFGNSKYEDYTQWATHIHCHYKKEIEKVLKVPQSLRTQWGVYKNLLCGVTSVVHHGPIVHVNNPVIGVYQAVQQLHSLAFEKGWKHKLNNPFVRKTNCVIHVGEGTNQKAGKEISNLHKWNFLKRKLVAIHGIQMKAEQARHFEALCWCPDSNGFMFGQTAKVERLLNHTKLLFGTDSTLTANWNIWEQLRHARQKTNLSDPDIFKMLTTNAAEVWSLGKTGTLAEGAKADMVVARFLPMANKWDSLFSINPKDILLVIQGGKIRLFDTTIAHQLQGQIHTNFTAIELGNATKFIEGNLSLLANSIRYFYPEANLPFKTTALSPC